MCIVRKIRDGVYYREEKGWCVLYGRYGIVCIVGKIRNGVCYRVCNLGKIRDSVWVCSVGKIGKRVFFKEDLGLYLK